MNVKEPSWTKEHDAPYLLTIDDLVEKTQLPKSWWYARTRERGPGSLPLVKCGKYCRFLWEDVQEWLEKQSNAQL